MQGRGEAGFTSGPEVLEEWAGTVRMGGPATPL